MLLLHTTSDLQNFFLHSHYLLFHITHLNRHIGYYCHRIPQEDRDTFLASLKNTPGRDNSVFDPVVFRGLIAKYFLHGEVAFRKADDPTWREMIKFCQPSFNVVSRQTVRADCMMLYEEEKLQLQDKTL